MSVRSSRPSALQRLFVVPLIATLVGPLMAVAPITAATALGATLSVGCGGDYATIADAVNAAAASGDTIHICQGTYNLTDGIAFSKTLTFYGDGTSGTGTPTIIDGTGSSNGLFRYTGSASVGLTDLTLQNSHNTRNSGPDYGDGGALWSAGAISLTRVEFSGNTSSSSNYGGGAVYGGGNVTVTDSVFTGNTADAGSSGYGGAIYAPNGSVTVSGSRFSGNIASYGGAIEADTSAISVTNSIFTGNRANGFGDGGAIYGVTVSVTDGTFRANQADSKAGAIAGTTVTVHGGSFTENTSGSSGGAIRSSGTVDVTGTVFSGNHAAIGNGGAIFAVGNVSASEGTFTGNSSSRDGGGIFANVGGVTAINSTFTGNFATNQGYGAGAIGTGGNGLPAGGGWVVVVGSTFTGNTGRYAGAIYGSGPYASSGASVIAWNSTFVGNASNQDGGAIYADSNAILLNATFLDNTAGDGSGAIAYNGVYDAGGKSSLVVGNTIFGSATDECHGYTPVNLIDLGGNIDVSLPYTSGCTDPAQLDSTTFTDASLIGFDPAGLADNGGPTHTVQISDTGFAADYGNPQYCYDAPVNNLDQRGVARHATYSGSAYGGACSSGAYEAIPSAPGAVYLEGRSYDGSSEGSGSAESCSNTPYTTIQGAVTAAVAGEVVHICAGTWDLSAGGSTPGPVNSSKSLTYVGDGTSGTNATILDGGGSAQLFHLDLAAGSAFAHLVFRNGSAATGAAIVNDQTGRIDVSDGVFVGNSADYYGGAIWTQGVVGLLGSSFTGNQAVYEGGGVGSNAAVEATASTFVDNTAGAYGGAIYGNIVTTTGSFFSGNIASGAGFGRDGGAIWSYGTITSTNDLFTGNHAAHYGGALAQAKSGDGAYVRGSQFDGNSAAVGGAILIPDGEADIAGSRFTGNTATGSGGAIQDGGMSTALIATSTFLDNSAGTDGGAISLATDAARINGSTFSGNSAAQHGGAIWSAGHPLKLWNDTFADNTAGTGYGGAVGVGNADLTVINATFVGNVATAHSSSGALSSGGGAMTLVNSIFGSASDECDQGGGTFNDLGGNIDVSFVGSGCIGSLSSQEIGSASSLGLGILADNGGPTPTISISDGSIARGYGIPSQCYDAAYVNNADQRGSPFDRHASTANPDPASATNYCDSGAFENQSATLPARFIVHLYVVADNTTRTFGQAAPIYTYTLHRDSSTGSLFTPPTALTTDPTCGSSYSSSTPVSSSPVAISCSGGVDARYDFAGYSDGTVTIGQATPGVTYTGTTTVNSGTNLTFSASLDPSACTGASSFTLTLDPTDGIGSATFPAGSIATTGWIAGTYSISIAYPGDANCAAATGSGSLSVTAMSVLLTYTGPTVIYHSTGTSAPVSLTASISPGAAGCQVGFTLVDGASNSFGAFYATTNNQGIATTAPITLNDGAYDVTVSTGGACMSPPDFTGTLTVSLGTLSKGSVGGGWYRSGFTPPKVGFGYQLGVTSTSKKVGTSTVVTTTTKGQLIWVTRGGGGWRLKAAVNYSSTSNVSPWSTFTCPGGVGVTGSSPKCGTFSGTGVLQVWDQTLNGGLGGWKTSTYGTVSYVVTVYDGGQLTTCKTKTTCTTTQYPDSLGITMKYGTLAVPTNVVPIDSVTNPATVHVLNSGQLKVW